MTVNHGVLGSSPRGGAKVVITKWRLFFIYIGFTKPQCSFSAVYSPDHYLSNYTFKKPYIELLVASKNKKSGCYPKASTSTKQKGTPFGIPFCLLFYDLSETLYGD
jgi:hypothetical protein